MYTKYPPLLLSMIKDLSTFYPLVPPLNCILLYAAFNVFTSLKISDIMK